MKSKIILIIILFNAITSLAGQERPDNQYIDLMLIRGEYNKVIDTCQKLLMYDNINHEIYYRIGMAYQNTMDEDRALESFYRAYSINPDDNSYGFMLARAWYGKGKYKPAEQLFNKLYISDTLNWAYASYLTSIYMQQNRYDEAINIYERFLKSDTANYRYLDKIAFASLKKGDFKNATELYTKSLSLNDRDLNAIKNLAYLYSAGKQSDTAIAILTNGIMIDSTDMSLYSMRAQLYYSKNYTKRALDDYLVILASGDSSELYLKRAGIGYCNNLQPVLALKYLSKTYAKDSSDYETCSYMAESYSRLKEMGKSIFYYNRAIRILTPIYKQLGLTYMLLAESQKKNEMYRDAISSYLKSQKISDNQTLYMIIANIYDEQLNDKSKAIYYYQAFLDGIKKSGGTFSGEYLKSIEDRLEYLKKEKGK